MDKTTNILLTVIALGLWANASAAWLRPANAQLPDPYLRSIDGSLSRIDNNIQILIRGGISCRNTKICD